MPVGIEELGSPGRVVEGTGEVSPQKQDGTPESPPVFVSGTDDLGFTYVAVVALDGASLVCTNGDAVCANPGA